MYYRRLHNISGDKVKINYLIHPDAAGKVSGWYLGPNDVAAVEIDNAKNGSDDVSYGWGIDESDPEWLDKGEDLLLFASDDVAIDLTEQEDSVTIMISPR